MAVNCPFCDSDYDPEDFDCPGCQIETSVFSVYVRLDKDLRRPFFNQSSDERNWWASMFEDVGIPKAKAIRRASSDAEKDALVDIGLRQVSGTLDLEGYESILRRFLGQLQIKFPAGCSVPQMERCLLDQLWPPESRGVCRWTELVDRAQVRIKELASRVRKSTALKGLGLGLIGIASPLVAAGRVVQAAPLVLGGLSMFFGSGFGNQVGAAKMAPAILRIAVLRRRVSPRSVFVL